MDDRLERNKQNVMAFYDMAFNQCKPAEAIELYAGEVYIQHNPHVGNGKTAFIDYFTRLAEEYPGKRVYFEPRHRRRGSGCRTHAPGMARRQRLGQHGYLPRGRQRQGRGTLGRAARSP